MDFAGKKIAFLGDSITEGYGLCGDLDSRYDNVTANALGALALNYGISGTRLAHQTKASATAREDMCFSGRLFLMDKTADAVVVYGGTNDYGHGDAPFGTLTDNTHATYMGAVRYIMENLRREYAGRPIVFLAPARRNGDESVYFRQTENPNARPLIAYVDAIKKIAAEYDIPVLDLYRDLGIDPNRAEDREAYAPDGLHFNAKGHARIAEMLTALLKNL
jgi:lysophospholipase L1-like esterase